jgi:hypothetical protein
MALSHVSHPRLSFDHFTRIGRTLSKLGIDAYLHGDKATQRLCGGHVAECRATVPWKCLISLTLRIIPLTGLGNRAFMVTA